MVSSPVEIRVKDRQTIPTEATEENWRRLVALAGDPQTPARAAYRCERFFRGLSPAGKTILEIGAGNGLLSAYALRRGAKRTIALEPESAGSTSGVRTPLQKLAAEFGKERMEVLPVPFQQYDAQGTVFDMILLCDSVNHLDEPACQTAHRSAAARAIYLAIFRKIADLLRPGGEMVLCDCSRYNAFGLCRLRSPLVPFIEWHKHQPPRFWARLLREAGLRTCRIDWHAIYPLRRLGRWVENPLAAFFLNSKFRLVAQKDTAE